MSDAPVIALDAVTKSFGAVTAVDRVSLALGEGEFFALLGPSGCGKTTLLRMIAGFEVPDTGSVLLDGQDITRLRANRRPINLMFQSYALFPHMSVRANIAYGLEMEKLPKSEIRQRTDAVLEQTQLGDLAGRRPDQLSGGQRQRVALARALVKRPRVLLLDEPLGALDKKLRETMQVELKRLQHDLGITFVVVTHDQDEALVLADRIALMRDGVIVQVGTPGELYEQPASRFAADFIGLTNFLDGIVAPDGLAVEGLGTIQAATNLEPGTKASLAIRPERMTLERERPDNSVNALQGTIADIAYHGRDLTVHVALADRDQRLLVRVPAPEDAAFGLAADQSIWVTWKPAAGRVVTDPEQTRGSRT